MSLYQQGDIFVTAGEAQISRTIRVTTRSKGEPPTRVNHVGVIIRALLGGDATIIEALSTVRLGRLSRYKDGRTKVAVYRRRNASGRSKAEFAGLAYMYRGKKYGYLKIGAHLGDYLLSKIRGRDVYFFRRMVRMDNYPICSWMVAFPAKKLGWTFGNPPVDPRFLTPDDIDDEFRNNPGEWEEVRPLSLL